MAAENQDLIKRINDAFMKGDLGFLSDYLSEETRWTIINISTIVGKDQIMKSMESQELQSLPEITVNNVVSNGDSFVVESSGRAIRKTGSVYRAAYCDVYRMKDGMIEEFTTYVIDGG